VGPRKIVNEEKKNKRVRGSLPLCLSYLEDCRRLGRGEVCTASRGRKRKAGRDSSNDSLKKFRCSASNNGIRQKRAPLTRLHGKGGIKTHDGKARLHIDGLLH